jgi:hypothetical protein
MHSSSLPKTLLHFHIGTPTKKSCKNLPIHPTQFATLKIESKTNVTQAVAFFIFSGEGVLHPQKIWENCRREAADIPPNSFRMTN